MKHEVKDGGKGDKDRTKNRKQFEENFDKIKFGTIKKPKERKGGDNASKPR